MRVLKLGLHGFGRFSDRQIQLGPGLNLVYGPNEAGKSTILKFILGMLYGFKRPHGHAREYTEEMQRYMPWDGEDYRGTMVYRLENGAAYRVERNFHPNREATRLYDEKTGRDVTGLFPRDRRHEVLFALDQMGVPQETFVSTAWVGQMEVSRVEMARELLDRIANLQQSGREDLSVRKILRLLEDDLREIGDERATTRPYARVLRLLQEKEQALAHACSVREEALRFESRLRAVSVEVADIESRIREAQHLMDWALLQEARRRLFKAEAMAENLGEAKARMAMLSQWAEFPVHIRDTLLRMEGEAENARTHCARVGQRLSQLQARLEPLDREAQPLRRLEGFGPEMGGQIAAAYTLYQETIRQLGPLRAESARLEEIVTKLDQTIEPLHLAAAHGGATAEHAEALEREIEAIRPKSDGSHLEELRLHAQALEKKARASGGWGYLLLGVALGFLGAVLYVGPSLSFGYDLGALLREASDLGPIAGALACGAGALLALSGFAAWQRTLARRRALWLDAKERYETARTSANEHGERARLLEREKEQVLLQVGATTLAELRGRLIRYEQLTARRDGQQLRLEAVNTELARLQDEALRCEEQVRAAVARWQGTAPKEALLSEEGVSEFRQALERLHRLMSQLDSLRREEEELARRRQEEESRAEQAEQERQRALAEAGVSSVEAFEEGVAGREQYLRARAEADRLEAVWTEHLGAETLEAMEDRVHQLAARVSGVEPERIPEVAAVQNTLRQLEAQKADLAAAVSDLTARVETALKDLPDLADLAREIAGLQEEKAEYDRDVAALEMAREVVSAAAQEIHQEFAPELSRLLGAVVSRLTEGRYQEVKVDEKAGLRVLTADDRLVDAHSLSSGTIDQFYFGLRFAVIDLLTRGEEKVPLILDDPFVQYDEARLAASMRFLAEQSRHYQIILCTCHDREMQIAQQLSKQAEYQINVVRIAEAVEG